MFERLSPEFWLQIIIYMGSLSAFTGSIMTRLKYLERKQDKHNNVLERLAKMESSTASAHHRISELSDDLKKIEKQRIERTQFERGGY